MNKCCEAAYEAGYKVGYAMRGSSLSGRKKAAITKFIEATCALQQEDKPDSEECECKTPNPRYWAGNIICFHCHKPIKQDKYCDCEYQEGGVYNPDDKKCYCSKCSKPIRTKPQLPEKISMDYIGRKKEKYKLSVVARTINNLIDCFEHYLKAKE